MLKLTEKSCEIYCLTIYAYFMVGTQVINHKLKISEVSIPDQCFFFNFTTNIYGVRNSNIELTNTHLKELT